MGLEPPSRPGKSTGRWCGRGSAQYDSRRPGHCLGKRLNAIDDDPHENTFSGGRGEARSAQFTRASGRHLRVGRARAS